jgi:hypothetical protein
MESARLGSAFLTYRKTALKATSGASHMGKLEEFVSLFGLLQTPAFISLCGLSGFGV